MILIIEVANNKKTSRLIKRTCKNVLCRRFFSYSGKPRPISIEVA